MNGVIFNLFGLFDITWYSVFILIGVIVGAFLLRKESKKYEISSEYCTNLIFWLIIIGILGARLYYVLFNLDYYLAYPSEIIKIWHGGLAIHGGVIAGAIFIISYAKRYDIRPLKMLDIVSVSLIIGQAIGRWGNFFNSEAHGPEVSRSVLESLKFIPSFIIDGMNINGVYYHPTFYYESLWCLLGFLILLLIRKVSKYLKAGNLCAFYLIWYGIGRYFIESLRTDSLMLFDFKIAQIVSLVLIFIGIIILIINARKGRFDNLYSDVEVLSEKF